MPTLVYVGNFRPSFSTENHYRRSFEEAGWTVVPVQEDRTTPNDVLATVVGSGANLVAYTRTWGLDPALTTELWRRLEADGIPSISIHLDRFWDLDRQRLITRRDRDPLFTTSVVFTADGDSTDRYRDVGVPHAFLRPGIVADEVGRVRPDPDRWAGIDVAFVGSERYHAEYPFRPALVAALAARYRHRFARIAGDTGYGTTREADLASLYATVPVVVGDSCFADRSEFYVSDRLYETLGRGGNLVFPAIRQAVEDYPDAFVRYDPGSIDAAIAAVDAALDEPVLAAERRRDRAVELTAARHTYRHRVDEIVATLLDLGLLRPLSRKA